jgi:hypothetical protein
MVEQTEIKSFRDLTQKVLNTHYILGLSSEVKIFNKSQRVVVFDLADQSHLVFVDIVEIESSSTRPNNLINAKRNFDFIANKFDARKYKYFTVFFEEITKNDRLYYNRSLKSSKTGEHIILDNTDILSLAKKYDISTDYQDIVLTDESESKIATEQKDSKENTPLLSGNDKNLKSKDGPARMSIIDIKLTPTQDQNLKTENKNFSKLKADLGNVNYYLTNQIFNIKNLSPKFSENNSWKSYSNNRSDVINSVRKNDIIFFNSTHTTKGISHVRIQVIGVVIDNKNDGHNLNIHWQTLDDHIDIKGLGGNKSIFTKIKDHNIDIILSEIIKHQYNLVDLINNLKAHKTKEKENSVTTIAGLLSDADSGTDHLDISKDVNAFAKVMSAKSFSPPLAIALLGKWGSGKSFFMRKLKERIEQLSKDDTKQNAYCSGIAHVHFNAWSYMDSNLWAGIITKIFEGLQEYITNDTLASSNKKEIEKTLTKKLNITHDEISNLENQKQNVDNKIEGLNTLKTEAEKKLKNKINEIKSKSIRTVLNNLDKSFNISNKISGTLASSTSFNKSADKFSEIVPREFWQNPTELYKKTKSKYTFVKTFFKGANWKKSLVCLCFILIFVISMKTVVFFVAHLLGKTDFTFPTKIWYYTTLIGAFIYRNYKTFKHLQPLISTFWEIKEDYELQKRDAIFKINQTEKVIKFEIENFRTELKTINTQINQAKQSKAEIEYRLENTLTTEALFSFIEKRSVSEDYKKHLGIISIIRKDFEILSELFSGHHDELNNSKESEKFKKQFNKPLERIILYIDDLDRCSEERVVQVLEAVNLLMAYPLFVVVVGVDPRWVKNALIKKHQLQFNNEYELKDSETIEPSSYLEKIFQVPFQLKLATDSSVKHMLRTLAESEVEIESQNDFLFQEESELADNLKDDKDAAIELKNIKNSTKQKQQRTVIIETIESLKFSDKEIELLQSMSCILGTNPRALKRSVNIYRIIKAHEDFNYNDESEEGELLAVMFLIALPLGKYRKLVTLFEDYLDNYLTNSMLEDFKKIKSHKTILLENKNPQLKLDQSELLINELLNVLQINQIDALLNQKMEVFKKHNAFIKRFTFNNL